MKTRGRFIAILAALSLLLAMLPAAPAVAVQGDIAFVEAAPDLDDDVSSYTANTVAGESFNIVTLRVDDSDEDVPSPLVSNFEIVAIADDVTETFKVDNPPIEAVASAFDIQDGIAYFTAVSVDRTEVTLHTSREKGFPLDATSSLFDAGVLTLGVGDLTGTNLSQMGDDAPGQGGPITAIRVEVVDTGGDSTSSDVVVILSGTRVDPETLATTAAAITDEVVDITAATDPVDLILANPIADTNSAGDIDAGDVTITFTDADDSTGPTTATVTSIDAEIGQITVDFSGGPDDDLPKAGDTLTVAYDGGEVINPIVTDGGTDDALSFFYLGDVDANIYEANSSTGASGFNIEYFETRVIAIDYTFNEANDTDYLDDDGNLQQSVNLRSSSNSAGVNLTLSEVDPTDGTADPASGVFIGKAALISEENLQTINEVITNVPLDTDGVPTADDIDDLIAALDALLKDAGDDASDWVAYTISALAGGVDGADIIDDLLDITLEVDHDDTITATYDDQGDAVVTDTATIDLNAPVISGVSPVEGDFTKDETPRFTATVVDEDSGIDLASLEVIVNTSAVTGDVSTDPILDGFDVEFIGGATELGADPGDPPAEYEWTLNISDDVGNQATTDDDDDGPIAFTIDTVYPDLDTAKTGIGLMLDVDDDDGDGDTDDYVEFEDPGWIKLTFNEAIDPDSLDEADFDVTGSNAPDMVMTSDGEDISSVADVAASTPEASYAAVELGSFVYLMVADLAADATPDIEVVDDIDDLAGNSLDDLTGDDAVEADDTIRPTLTISLSATLGADEDEITITVSSDEGLDDIDVVVTNEETNEPTAVTMVRVGSTDVWNGDFEIGDSTEYTVEATGTDTSGNDGTEDDIFEGDIDAPGDSAVTANTFDANTVDLEGTDPEVEEGAIWIVSTFGEDDEYLVGEDGDTHDSVTVTAISLEDEDGNTITDAVGDLFTDDDLEFTLAITLVPGDYTFAITAEDDAGNEVASGDLDFEVTGRDPFDLELLPGVNLISIPSDPVGDGGNINVLFEGLPITSITTYDRATDLAGGDPWPSSSADPETGLFTGDIAVLEPGKAYFVTATASTTVEVDLAPVAVVLPPTIQVLRGFNTIGFWTVSGDAAADIDAYLNSIRWSVAYSFSPVPGEGWSVIRPDDELDNDTDVESGMGYLVFVTQDGTLTP